MKGIGCWLLLATLAGPAGAGGDSTAIAATLRFTRWEGETRITRDHMLAIQQFIIEQGHRETYSSKFNDNPAYKTARFHFYLEPDTGQENMNCELDKSGFHTLVIRWPDHGRDQYRRVEFLDPHDVYVTATYPTEDLTVGQIRQFVVDAMEEIQAAMAEKDAE